MSIRLLLLSLACFSFDISVVSGQNKPNYHLYYEGVIRTETLISKNEFSEALTSLEDVFDSYNFIFLREYKVATQLALSLGDSNKAIYYLRLGILGGWTLKDIEKNDFLKPLRRGDDWKKLKSQYDSLRDAYFAQLNLELREEVQSMYKDDQKYAIRYLLKLGTKAKTRFANKKIVPQSERQLAQINQIMDTHGYPGEKLIGNNYWVSTILSHHNSITLDYVQKDRLYPALKPRLSEAIEAGELWPIDYAIIEDWYVAVKSERQEAAYGFLNSLSPQTLNTSNDLRLVIGLRSVELRNDLVDIQYETGMNFYLGGEPWVKGKIIVDENY